MCSFSIVHFSQYAFFFFFKRMKFGEIEGLLYIHYIIYSFLISCCKTNYVQCMFRRSFSDHRCIGMPVILAFVPIGTQGIYKTTEDFGAPLPTHMLQWDTFKKDSVLLKINSVQAWMWAGIKIPSVQVAWWSMTKQNILYKAILFRVVYPRWL